MAQTGARRSYVVGVEIRRPTALITTLRGGYDPLNSRSAGFGFGLGENPAACPADMAAGPPASPSPDARTFAVRHRPEINVAVMLKLPPNRESECETGEGRSQIAPAARNHVRLVTLVETARGMEQKPRALREARGFRSLPQH